MILILTSAYHTTLTMSPYPWIADSLWMAWQRRATDADRTRPIVNDCLVIPVSDDDRARAARLGGDGKDLPPAGTVATHEQLLFGTHGAGRVVGGHWPVCCDRLATLIFIHGAGEEGNAVIDSGRADGCLLASVAEEAGQPLADAVADWNTLLKRVREHRHSGEGISLFHCRACGRVYGSYMEA